MNFYLFVLAFLFLGAFLKKDKKVNDFFLLLSAGLIYLLMALKESITGDYSRYAHHFITSAYKTIDQMAADKGELGFHAMTKAINSLTQNVNVYFAITGAILIIAMLIFIKNNAENKLYAIYFYYTIGLFAFNLAGLRQALAMSICLFAFPFIKRKNIIGFLAVVGVAFLFHKSAVFFLAAFPIAWFKWKWNYMIAATGFFGIMFVSFVSLHRMVADWLGYETYDIESAGNGGLFFVIMLGIGILGLFHKERLLRQNKMNIIFLNLHLGATVLWIFRLFSRTVERPIYYFLFATIILLDQICSLEMDRDIEIRSHQLIRFSALVLFGVFFVYRLLRDTNLLPYIWIIGS